MPQYASMPQRLPVLSKYKPYSDCYNYISPKEIVTRITLMFVYECVPGLFHRAILQSGTELATWASNDPDDEQNYMIQVKYCEHYIDVKYDVYYVHDTGIILL